MGFHAAAGDPTCESIAGKHIQRNDAGLRATHVTTWAFDARSLRGTHAFALCPA